MHTRYTAGHKNKNRQGRKTGEKEKKKFGHNTDQHSVVKY